jgi:hypothetical protein
MGSKLLMGKKTRNCWGPRVTREDIDSIVIALVQVMIITIRWTVTPRATARPRHNLDIVGTCTSLSPRNPRQPNPIDEVFLSQTARGQENPNGLPSRRSRTAPFGLKALRREPPQHVVQDAAVAECSSSSSVSIRQVSGTSVTLSSARRDRRRGVAGLPALSYVSGAHDRNAEKAWGAKPSRWKDRANSPTRSTSDRRGPISSASGFSTSQSFVPFL